MNGKVFVGQKALSLTEYEKTAPISGVILWVDDENCYEAGDETGTVIEQDCLMLPSRWQIICLLLCRGTPTKD